MLPSSFFISIGREQRRLYDETEDYCTISDDNLFTNASLDNMDEIRVVSSGNYLASEADIEDVDMSSFLENSSDEGTMSGDDHDHDHPIPKEKSMINYSMQR